jgi:tetratricopeptide (TPR) repeat protein
MRRKRNRDPREIAAGEAVALAQQVLLSTQDLGPTHPSTIRLRYELALKYEAAGRPAECLDGLERLLPGAVRALGPRDELTLQVRAALARSMAAVGRVRDAAATEDLLVRDLGRVHGEDHHLVAHARQRSIAMHELAGDQPPAAPAAVTVLEPEPQNDPEALRTRAAHGLALLQAGEAEWAVSEMTSALIDQVRLLGPLHTDTLQTRANLALGHVLVGRVDEGIASLEQLVRDMMPLSGLEPEAMLTVKSSLASVYAQTGRLEQGRAALQQLLGEQERLLGRRHPATFSTRHNLLFCRTELGEAAEAVPQIEQLVGELATVLGPEHADTTLARHLLVHAQVRAEGTVNAVAAL